VGVDEEQGVVAGGVEVRLPAVRAGRFRWVAVEVGGFDNWMGVVACLDDGRLAVKAELVEFDAFDVAADAFGGREPSRARSAG
jgi:hypothetical protein